MPKKVSNSKILTAALDLFSSKGYAETKMVDIAGAVGISVGTMYLRFKNKETLCLELIQDQTKDYEGLAWHIVESSKDPVEALKSYISFCLEYGLKKKQLIFMFYREHTLSFLNRPLQDITQTQLKLIETILERGIKKDVMRPLDTKDTALVILAGIRGAVMLKLMFGAGDPKVMADTLFNLTFNGIRKDAP